MSARSMDYDIPERSWIESMGVWGMVSARTALASIVVGLVVIVLLAYTRIIDAKMGITLFLLLLMVLAYLRREEKLPYKELTDNIF